MRKLKGSFGDLIDAKDAALADEQPAPQQAGAMAKLIALREMVEASRNGFLDGQPYVLTYSDIIEELRNMESALATAPPEQAEVDLKSFNLGFSLARTNLESLARSAVSKGWTAEGLVKLLFESPFDQSQAASAGALREELKQVIGSRLGVCDQQFYNVLLDDIVATLAAHDQALKCPICSKPLSSGISWCKTCDVTHAVSCVECHPCGYINTGPCELGKSAAHDQKVYCDSCKQDLSSVSRGHYTILCHKPRCYSLKDGYEANVALVKTVRALGMRVRELEGQLEGKGDKGATVTR